MESNIRMDQFFGLGLGERSISGPDMIRNWNRQYGSHQDFSDIPCFGLGELLTISLYKCWIDGIWPPTCEYRTVL
jgi:hypothetical protein